VNKNAQASEDFLTGTRPVDDTNQIIKEAGAKAVNPVRRLSFFERQVANALNKTLTGDGMHIDLNENANRTNANSSKQRQNRNALVDPIEDAQEIDLTKAREGDLGRHARFCKRGDSDVQGRACRICHGMGYYAFEKVYKQRQLGKSVNASRFDVPSKG
jgi:hypothetical protein